MVALDAASKALTDRNAGDIDLLASFKNGCGNGVTRLEAVERICCYREFFENARGLNTSLCQVTTQGFSHACRTTLAECNLNSGIAVRFGRLDLCDAIVRHIEHCDGDGSTILGKNARHADLASYKA